MPPNELVRPKWRDGNAYRGALREHKVKERVSEEMAREYDGALHPNLKFGDTAIDEAKNTIEILLRELGLVDFGNINYWIALILFALLFLGGEILIFCFSPLLTSYYVVVFAISSVVTGIILTLSLLAAIKYHGGGRVPSPLNLICKSDFHTVPIVTITASLLLINAHIIWSTGGTNSPYLPLLFSMVTFMVAIPRENSPAVYIVLSLAAATIWSATMCSQNIDPTSDLAHWSALYKNAINVSVFAYSLLSALTLRIISIKRIV